ncbi:putative tail sheath stabilizer and completion protein [Escherichia phage vB_EcoM_WFK]|nr:putative tail sheath stabilizer and completion protein [Escherichia phage vB_EcoM_WFL6982]QBQ77185.1 putative tail sheath stabilizer and completion protein [Escherichia phage vB_EcoM_WFK]
MFGYFYNSSFRRYITMMGDLFSNIQVNRQLSTGNKLIRVPITYASKEHFMMKLNKWTSINSQEDVAKVETILPRINLQMVDFVYNPTFKTNILNNSLLSKSTKDIVDQYNPSPIKMIFELSIFTRYEDDMFQIVEQIIPYFQPHFNTTMIEQYGQDIPFERDIKVVWMAAAMDEQIDGDNLSRRRLEWSLTFEVNGWMYPPVGAAEGLIKTTYLDFHANERDLQTAARVFESVDTEIKPRDVEAQDWNGEVEQTYTHDIPIPTPPTPPGPRKQ